MSSVKDYESVVKQINSSKGDARNDLVQKKFAILESLRAKCKNGAEKRQLKFQLDEANNS